MWKNPYFSPGAAACALVSMGVLTMGCKSMTKSTGASADRAFFAEEVKPILEKNCLRCHSGAPGRLNLTSREAAMAPVDGEKPFIVPGSPDRSRLVTAIGRNGTHPRAMPRLNVSLTDMEIGVLRDWIADGAVWPSGPAGRLTPQFNPENP